MVEELTVQARKAGFMHKSEIKLLSGHVVSISSNYLINKLVYLSNAGDLLTGISVSSVKQELRKFKQNMDNANIRFKVVFNGPECFSDKGIFPHFSQTQKKFFHLMWQLEITRLLLLREEDTEKRNSDIDKARKVKQLALGSLYYRLLVEREIAEYVYDIMYEELHIEFIIAPAKANNQLVWLYSYDYCEAVVGDLSLLPYSDTLPQVILDLDFETNQFEYISTKELNESLKLVKGKEKRQFEIWGYAIPIEMCSEHDICIIISLEDKLAEIQNKIESNRVQTSDKLRHILEKIASVFSKIDSTQNPGSSNPNDRFFSENYTTITAEKWIRRESNIYKLDHCQVINSSCDYAVFPGTRTYLMNETDKQKLKSSVLYDFSMSKKLCSFLSFDLFNPKLITLVSKVSKFRFYVPCPISDSKEYRALIENTLPREVESSFSYFISTFGKTIVINEFGIENYFTNEPLHLSIKDRYAALESGDLTMHYFKDGGYKRYEKDMNIKNHKTDTDASYPYKHLVTMMFHYFKSAAESSEVSLHHLSLKRFNSGTSELALSKREIINMIMINVLNDLDYYNVKNKKFMILGAAIMRCNVEQEHQEKILLIVELIKLNLLNGEFMNPPEMNLMKNRKKKDDKYLVTSLRKTSEEIRVKTKVGVQVEEEDTDNLHTSKRKESEFVLHLDGGELSRPATNYDYGKIVNVISQTIEEYKQHYIHIASTHKQLSDDAIEMFANGIHDDTIPKILMISRVFAFVDAQINYGNKDEKLVDFDTSQFVAVVGLIQKMLRYKTEGYFSFAVHIGGKTMTLKDLEEIKVELPFRTHYAGHLSSLIKRLLIQYIIWLQSSKSKGEMFKFIDQKLTLTQIQSDNPEFTNLRSNLMEGFNLFLSFESILDYVMQRGIDKTASPILSSYIDSKELLKDCFKKIGISDTN